MTARPRLLILDDWEGRLAAAAGTRRMREFADVVVLDRPLSDVADSFLAEVRVLMAVRERTHLDAATLGRMPALKLVLQTGGHAYHLDGDETHRRGIVVALGRQAQAPRAAVPELTFALMISALRHMGEAQKALIAGEWPVLIGRTLAGRRLGLLGTGRHGSRVADIARAFGMDVVAWARPGSEGADRSIPRVGLNELLATSDVVSIHLRLSEDSFNLLDAITLRKFKHGAVLVNTSRGAIIDEEALAVVLRDGPLAAAALDVFAEEPLPAESPLRSLPNVVMTPHIGWTVEEVFDEFADIAAQQLADFLDNSLDPEQLLGKSASSAHSDHSTERKGS